MLSPIERDVVKGKPKRNVGPTLPQAAGARASDPTAGTCWWPETGDRGLQILDRGTWLTPS